ncbi:ISAs1 family transposase [Chitinimonas arctica]|uniref:ISAs1 family transposase n=1 Tax=Chitinimonas arctica TaxID=2594795 RepID=A0A516SKS8_9NEIS|nr:ISAs1 family transposase [Chitinimonas arctica]
MSEAAIHGPIGCITSARSVKGRQATLEVRYYISSRDLSATELAEAVRAHWGIENRLHWMLDVNFSEDGATVRKDNAPQNLALLRKIVLNVTRADTTDPHKGGPSKKRKHADWDDGIRANMLGLTLL